MEVTHVIIKNGKAQGFNRNLLVRTYGSSFGSQKAVYVTADDATVTVSYNDGTAVQYDKKRGIKLVTL